MKIPKYVYELVELGRLRPAPLDEQANSSIAGQGEYGYMFRVYRKSNSQSGGVFVAEVERITAWARREYAESNIHTYRWYTDKEHRKPYYKAGGRDFDDYQLLKATMDKLLCNITDEITVVCGQAKGADTLGEQYAMEKGYTIDYYPAQWKLYGKRAGYLRNEQMAQNADALAAFWNGESRGTKNMIELAKRYGLKVRVKRY